MTKNFFVVVSYTPAMLQGKVNKGMLSGLFSKKEKSGTAKTDQEESFEENRTQLEQRIAVVEQGLVRCGVRIARLGTEEVTEIFYRVFNPGESEKSIKLGS